MIEVYSDRDYTRVGLMKSILDNAGIPCFIQNQHTNSLMANIPLPLFHPKLWILDESAFEEAAQLIREALGGLGTMTSGEEWQCRGCCEWVPVEFGSCWNCELMREEDEGASTPIDEHDQQDFR